MGSPKALRQALTSESSVETLICRARFLLSNSANTSACLSLMCSSISNTSPIKRTGNISMITNLLQLGREISSYNWSLHASAAAAAKLLQSCPTLCDPTDGSPPDSPWDSPGKNTGVGCNFILQCMKVKSQSDVTQSCPTLSDPMDCSLPGSSAHGILQARVLE